MNAATGLVLVLPGKAADLKRLHAMVGLQLSGLLDACGIAGPLAQAECDAWQQPAVYACNQNRSLVASMNQRKYEAWVQFAYNRLTAFEVALRMLETPFARKDLPKGYHDSVALLRAQLLPSAKIVPLQASSHLH